MTDSEKLDALLNRAKMLGDWLVGSEADGVGHAARFAAEIRELQKRFPFVVRDPPWLDFLTRYGGATLSAAPHGLGMSLYGVSHEGSLHLLKGPGEPVESGCLGFAAVSFDRNSSSGRESKNVSLGFGFEATGERLWGVYRIGDSGTTWYCATFLEWLERFVEQEGLLDD